MQLKKHLEKVGVEDAGSQAEKRHATNVPAVRRGMDVGVGPPTKPRRNQSAREDSTRLLTRHKASPLHMSTPVAGSRTSIPRIYTSSSPLPAQHSARNTDGTPRSTRLLHDPNQV